MTKLLQMSLKVATTVARTSAQLVEVALDRVRGGGRGDAARWTPAPPPPSTPVPPREPWTDVGTPIVPPPPAPDPPDVPPIAAVPEPTLDVPPVPEPTPDAPPIATEPTPDVPPIAPDREPDVPPIAPDREPDVPPIAAVPEPTPGEAARIREQRREAETTAESPGAEVQVDEPWQGYASMNAPEIIDRLAVSDAAVKAVVLLYEGSHRARKTVLRAAAR